MSLVCGVLIILIIIPISSGEVYVRRGSNITDCSLTCPRTDGVLEMYRECGGQESRLMELWCDNLWSLNHYEPRLLLNTSSGCWTITDAGKDDSCVYHMVYLGKVGRPLTTLPIIVLDPVLISTITSNSSRLGQDIAVRVQFSGEETAVTWEVDGGPLPDRYRLIDDNRMLLIPSAQRDDDRRRLSVRITNPVSEETGEYQLEITDSGSSPLSYIPVVIVVMIFLVSVIFPMILYVKHYKKMKLEDVERNENREEHGGLTGRSSEHKSPYGSVDGKIKELCLFKEQEMRICTMGISENHQMFGGVKTTEPIPQNYFRQFIPLPYILHPRA